MDENKRREFEILKSRARRQELPLTVTTLLRLKWRNLGPSELGDEELKAMAAAEGIDYTSLQDGPVFLGILSALWDGLVVELKELAALWESEDHGGLTREEYGDRDAELVARKAAIVKEATALREALFATTHA